MQTFELSNPSCRLTLTPEQGGRVLTLTSARSGIQHVGPYHLQTWLKYGAVRDPGNDGLMLFWGDLHGRTFEVAAAPPAADGSGGACQLRAESAGVEFRKRYTLDPSQPVLTLECFVTNRRDAPLNVQVECFLSWSFGAASERKNVVTHVLSGDRVTRLPVTPYGSMFIRPFDIPPGAPGVPGEGGGGALALCDLDHLETLIQLPDLNWRKFTAYQMTGSSMRGPYSVERELRPGETLETRLRIVLCTGAAAIDGWRSGLATGLGVAREVCFTDEPLRVAVAAGRLDAAGAIDTRCTVSVDGDERPPAHLRAPGEPYTGASLPFDLDLSADRGASAVTLRAAFHPSGQTSEARVHVLDAEDAGARAEPILLAASPVFPVRAIHLILSQQAAEGLSIDAMKWLLERVVAPCGFTHVIWEFNKALRFDSHPELAEDWSYPARDVGDLARFTRALGLEPIPQQNLFGHQHETNLAKVYPHLQEVPGDVSVYCPSHPETRRIVADLVGELMDLFEARLFHMGHDEIQFRDCPQKIGVCPRCATRPPAQVFADDVNAIDAVVKGRGGRSILWGDNLIPPDLGGANVNGELGEVYRAVDLIPRDAIIADWHYHPTENYRSTEFFLGKGFETWCTVWFPRPGIKAFARHGAAAGARGLISTHWSRPDLTSLPVESLLYAAQAAQDPASLDDPGLDERITLAAHRLWREWQKWSAR